MDQARFSRQCAYLILLITRLTLGSAHRSSVYAAPSCFYHEQNRRLWLVFDKDSYYNYGATSSRASGRIVDFNHQARYYSPLRQQPLQPVYIQLRLRQRLCVGFGYIQRDSPVFKRGSDCYCLGWISSRQQ